MRRDPKKFGFTLLELLTVIAIMAALSTMAVASYFGAIRGMTRRSALKHLVNTLVLAKQRASMEGVRMSVMIYNEMTGVENNKEVYAPSYVIIRELGRVTDDQNGGRRIYDEFTPLETYFGSADTEAEIKNKGGKYDSMRLYNLDEGEWKDVYTTVLRDSKSIKVLSDSDGAKGLSVPTPQDAKINNYCFVVNPDVNGRSGGSSEQWEIGTRYGIDVSPPNSLPRRFTFTKIDEDEDRVIVVTFDPDGKVVDEDGEGISQTIEIEERLGNGKKKNTIKVDEQGDITYDEKWR